MPFNGSGVFQRVRNWVADAAGGVKIRADFHDNEDDGFATGLTNCITKDGQTIVTQNIPWNNKRITGLADPVNPQDAATKAFSDGKVAKTGDIMTGNLGITSAGPVITLTSTAADGSMQVLGNRNALQRWLLRPGNGEAESGANAGSNFDVHHYADDGAYLGRALWIERKTGLGLVKGDPTDPNGIANKNYVDVLHNGQQSEINGKQGALGFTPVQQGGGAYQLSNKVYIGWDNAGLRAQVDATDLGYLFTSIGNPPVGGLTNARLAFAGNVAASTGPQSTPYEPYSGAVITGWQWAIVGYATVTAFKLRYMQMQSGGSWWTVGYA